MKKALIALAAGALLLSGCTRRLSSSTARNLISAYYASGNPLPIFIAEGRNCFPVPKTPVTLPAIEAGYMEFFGYMHSAGYLDYQEFSEDNANVTPCGNYDGVAALPGVQVVLTAKAMHEANKLNDTALYFSVANRKVADISRITRGPNGADRVMFTWVWVPNDFGKNLVGMQLNALGVWGGKIVSVRANQSCRPVSVVVQCGHMERAIRERKRRSREAAAALVREHEASGLTQREFCRQRGVALSTFTLYRRRAGAAAGAPRAKLIPVQVLAGAGLVLAHPRGVRIEVGAGFDGDALRRLLETLEA